MKKISLESKIFLLFEITILIVGVAVSWYFGVIAFEKDKDALLNRVNNISVLVPSDIVEELDGSISDLSNPSYLYLKRKMVELKSINSDARFVYLMGYRQDVNKLFFFVDSESPQDTDSYSPPGQVYEDSTEFEIDNFIKGVAFAEGPYTDSWGRWVSAYAPITSSETKLPIAVIGIDVGADSIIKDVIYAAGLPALMTILLIMVFGVFHKRKIRQKEDELSNIKIEFTSFISHEIFGFITKMKTGLRSLNNEEYGALSDDQKSFIHSMVTQSDDFSDLVQEFLDIGNIERDNEISLSKSESNIIDLIKGVVGDLRDVLDKKSITVIYEGNVPEKIYSNCDNNKISRVFANILSNSIKYSPERSSIRVGYIDGNVDHTIYIKDEGMGIPENEKSKVFSKFFRAENAKVAKSAGTGLGLYFSKLIIEKHNGKMWFESTEGKGATFFISIPKIN